MFGIKYFIVDSLVKTSTIFHINVQQNCPGTEMKLIDHFYFLLSKGDLRKDRFFFISLFPIRERRVEGKGQKRASMKDSGQLLNPLEPSQCGAGVSYDVEFLESLVNTY